MKRLVLALVSALLLAVFIAFNYLLWEREGREEKLRQLETNNASKNESMNSLSGEIKDLEEENRGLNSSINQLKSLNLSLQGEVQQLKQERAEYYKEIANINLLIDALKKQANIKIFEELMVKWTEAIDSQKYEAAYKLEYGWKSPEEIKISLGEYSELYRNSLKNLQLKSVKIDTDSASTVSEQLSLILIFEAKLVENADVSKSIFVNGENKKLFRLRYLNEKDGFVIENISDIQK